MGGTQTCYSNTLVCDVFTGQYIWHSTLVSCVPYNYNPAQALNLYLSDWQRVDNKS